MSLGKRLREVRNERKLKQKEFVEKLGCSVSAYSKYETDMVEPNEVFINSFCREYGVSKVWLLEGKGNKYINNRELGIYINQLMSGQIEEIKKAGMAMRDLKEHELRAILEVLESYKK